MAANRGRHVLSLSRKRKYRHNIEDDKPVRKIPNNSSEARCENEEHIVLLGGVDEETNITQPSTQPPMATCSIQCNNKDTDVGTVLNPSSDAPVNHRLTDNIISSQGCRLTVIAPVQSSYVSLTSTSTKQLCCDVFNNRHRLKCKKIPDEFQVPMDSFIISNRKSEIVELEEQRGTIEEQGGTMEEQGGIMEEPGDTMEEQGSTMEERGGTMEELGSTMEEKGSTMEEEGCIMEEHGSTLSRSKSEQPLYNRKKYHGVNLLKRSVTDTLGKEIIVPCSRRVCPSYKWIPGIRLILVYDYFVCLDLFVNEFTY